MIKNTKPAQVSIIPLVPYLLLPWRCVWGPSSEPVALPWLLRPQSTWGTCRLCHQWSGWHWRLMPKSSGFSPSWCPILWSNQIQSHFVLNNTCDKSNPNTTQQCPAQCSDKTAQTEAASTTWAADIFSHAYHCVNYLSSITANLNGMMFQVKTNKGEKGEYTFVWSGRVFQGHWWWPGLPSSSWSSEGWSPDKRSWRW